MSLPYQQTKTLIGMALWLFGCFHFSLAMAQPPAQSASRPAVVRASPARQRAAQRKPPARLQAPKSRLALPDTPHSPPLAPPKIIKTPRLSVRLIAEYKVVAPGQTLWVAIRQTIKRDWHTYWRNPGDSGTAPKIRWKLPKGVRASAIKWPLPHEIKVAHLVNYGYDSDNGHPLLLVKITIPKTYTAPTLTLQGHFVWLVCKEECIPGKGDLALTLRVGPQPQIFHRWHRFFERAVAALPKTSDTIKLTAQVTPTHIKLQFATLSTKRDIDPGATFRFFPITPSVLHNSAKVQQRQSIKANQMTLSLRVQKNDYFTDDIAQLKGVLVARWSAKGVYFQRGYTFTTWLKQPTAPTPRHAARKTPTPTPARAIIGTTPTRHQPAAAPVVPTRQVPRQPSTNPPAARQAAGGLVDFVARAYKANASQQSEAPDLVLWQALLFALLGGLLLNLMPCVFPVLSIKVMHFVEQANQTSSSVRKHGLAFVFGVMLSFSLLAGALLLLRASGQMLGWGFQLQSPLFVWALLVLLFGMGLSLSGVFEFGTSIMSVGEDLTHTGGYTGSFFTGVLATIVATPCTAPLMAPALGWALTQPAATSLLVFNALGLGMALPYALFSAFPHWLRFLPRPGAWMERLKQVMAFALYATAIWLLWVLGKQSGIDGAVTALIGLLIVAFAGWIYGSTRYHKRERLALIVAGALLVGGLAWSSQQLHLDAKQHAKAQATQTQLTQKAAGIASHGQQQAFDRHKIDRLLQQRQHVLLNMTAAWCISCKVNEKVALKQAGVQKAMRQHQVYYLVGDWTNQDDEITKVLAMFKRSGVPLYVLFDGQRRTLTILPQLLTPGILQKAMQGLTHHKISSSL